MVDIETLRVDETLEKPDRTLRYLREIANPYRFRVGETIVNVTFAENGAALQDALAKVFCGGG